MNLNGVPVRCFLAHLNNLSLVKIPRKKLVILAKIQSYIMGNDEWGKSKTFASKLTSFKLPP